MLWVKRVSQGILEPLDPQESLASLDPKAK